MDMRKENPLGVEPIGRLALKFALPATIALVVNALYNIVDQIFIGQSVGYLGNAATNVIYPLTVIMLAIASLWGDGCAAHTSLQLGKGDKEKASLGFCNMFLMSLVMGLILMAVSLVFLNPLCRLFGATENSLSYAVHYGRIIAIGFPFVSILVPLTSCIRADGSPNYAMGGLFVGCGANIVLDALFVMGFGWGVQGAAAATIIGELANAVYVLFYIPRFKNISVRKPYFALKAPVINRVAGLGVSSLIFQLSIALIVAVSNNMFMIFGKVSKYGADIPIAAMGIAMKINQIVINVVIGISTGMQPIIGYNYGAGKYDRAKAGFRVVVISGTVFLAAATVLFQLAPMALISLFGSESELYNEFAVMCLRIFLMICVLNGLQIGTGYLFQSVGKPVLASINTLSKQIILLPLSMIILSCLIGVTGSLWAGPFSDAVAFVISLILLRRSWHKIFPAKLA